MIYRNSIRKYEDDLVHWLFITREKCPNTKLFLLRIFLYLDCGKFPYSVRVQEKTEQKKLRIWTLRAVYILYDL